MHLHRHQINMHFESSLPLSCRASSTLSYRQARYRSPGIGFPAQQSNSSFSGSGACGSGSASMYLYPSLLKGCSSGYPWGGRRCAANSGSLEKKNDLYELPWLRESQESTEKSQNKHVAMHKMNSSTVEHWSWELKNKQDSCCIRKDEPLYLQCTGVVFKSFFILMGHL